ncbi:hypothetical protein QNO09_33375 [Streptomyces sp. 378]|uniref:hypothetical protein n=1 Tax=Streptomyces sp. 378 TaxID=3049412 RepID=UPI0024C40C2C|nr:hypothetical protein [Streptomyces sp. 378]MDK1348089.1 hypothetical protein [Streptomyces sp. 378]
MDFAGTNEPTAASGLRAAVDFYVRKAELLQRRQRDLEEELVAVQAELNKACTTRDQLATDLDEILTQQPGVDEEQDADPEAAGESDAPTSDEPPAAAAAPRPGTKRGTVKASQPGKKTSAKSGEVMRAIEQVLATSGKPMHVRDLTAALSRPTEGKAGTAAVETIRATCKRLAGHGRISEVKTAVFAITRASETGQATQSGPGNEAGLKGAT